MKSNRLFWIVILFTLGVLMTSSCEDVVEVEIPQEDINLVSVEAYINTKLVDNIYVKLEQSLPVNTSIQNPAISGAIVEISDNATDPNLATLEEEGTSGIYKLPEGLIYEAVPGRTYKLAITTPEGTLITGEEYLQKGENLDTVKINLSARGDYEFLSVFVNSQETPGLGNYYKWDIYKNGLLINDAENMSFVNDELVDGNYVYDFEIFTDFIDPDEEDEDAELQIGDTIYVEQLSISKSAYEFYFGMTNQAFAGSPFSVPPANLPGNLAASRDKRVLGLFSARDVSEGNLIIIDSTNYTPIIPSVIND